MEKNVIIRSVDEVDVALGVTSVYGSKVFYVFLLHLCFDGRQHHHPIQIFGLEHLLHIFLNLFKLK
jgi:hypothetical protein